MQNASPKHGSAFEESVCEAVDPTNFAPDAPTSYSWAAGDDDNGILPPSAPASAIQRAQALNASARPFGARQRVR